MCQVGQAIYSHPGQALWSQTFSPGQYQAANNFTTTEWWHDPAAQPPTWYSPWRHEHVPVRLLHRSGRGVPASEGTIYWLGVSNPSGPANFSFGWKTTYKHWNDDACWLDSAGDLAGVALWRQPSAQRPIHGPGLRPLRRGVTLRLDFGDAPSPYPTLLASDGARHFAGARLLLGTVRRYGSQRHPTSAGVGRRPQQHG